MKQLTCIDLFSGCGGLSLGLERAGYSILAAIDFDPEATRVFRKNFPGVARVLHEDLTKFSPQELAKLIGIHEVDVVVGGPPCQGFSAVRQRDGANSGPRMVEDKRRLLYREFLWYVEFFRPKVFVMENVLGIKSAAHGRYFTNVQREARKMGYRVHPQVERASDLGVPQKRVRQLIVGTRLDLAAYFPGKLGRAPRAVERPTLGEAIGDLPALKAGNGEEDTGYDMKRRKVHVAKYGRQYLYDTLEVQRAGKLTAHRARPHSERDLRDFGRLREGENCGQAIRRGEVFEFPYDRKSFKDRYTRQNRGALCSTVVAHMSKDGLMFIHPTQKRSLTPREAARVQSFPDWFEFPVARTHQFRLIGNAVPPLVAESLGLAIRSYLSRASTEKSSRRQPESIPRDHGGATQELVALVNAADSNTLRKISVDQFRRGWFAVGFLYPELHPDSALEHGTHTSSDTASLLKNRKIEHRLLAPYYVQSGWPVALAPVAKEAWRRYEVNELSDEEFYCSQAVVAGMCYRSAVAMDGLKGQKIAA